MHMTAALLDLPREWYRPADVAREWDVSRATLYRWVKTGRVPAVTIAGTVRVPRAALESIATSAMRDASANLDENHSDEKDQDDDCD